MTMDKPAFLRNKETKSLVTEDRQTIFYDHYRNGHSKLVVIAHGFFNSKDSVLLTELGQELFDCYDAVIMDFRGHGQSTGLFYWTAKEHMDLIAVLKDVRQGYEHIGLIGFSLGAAISIITAIKVDWIHSMISVSAPTEFRKIEYHFWALDIENDIFYNLTREGRKGKGIRPGPFWLKKDKPIDLVDKIKVPILFLHGEADWLIRPWHAQALYNKTKTKKKIAIIKKGPHAEYLIRKNKEETVRLMRDWLKTTLISYH